jgi:hypothetical protein
MTILQIIPFPVVSGTVAPGRGWDRGKTGKKPNTPEPIFRGLPYVTHGWAD